jgi:hypothetical protein
MVWIGCVQVRQQGGQNAELKAEYLQELNEREMKAQTEGYGIWNKASGFGFIFISDRVAVSSPGSLGWNELRRCPVSVFVEWWFF